MLLVLGHDDMETTTQLPKGPNQDAKLWAGGAQKAAMQELKRILWMLACTLVNVTVISTAT